MDPFAIQGPAAISFSGGRTSALMLWRILRALGGRLPPDVVALFANTGKEREETLRFVAECASRWGVEVHWLERRPGPGGVREVTFHTASRQGEPYAELIRERAFLPNPVTRFCTTELKIRPIKAWMLEHGFTYWTNVVGLRRDEPHRVANLRAAEGKERWDYAFPLYDGQITKADVDAFWRAQPFDLGLNFWEGNCDLCFLKGQAKRRRVMYDRPDLVAWWVEQERAQGAKFRGDAPSYSVLAAAELAQLRMPFDPAVEIPAEPALDDLGDCLCTGAE